jgi:hypothetical protein
MLRPRSNWRNHPCHHRQTNDHRSNT